MLLFLILIRTYVGESLKPLHCGCSVHLIALNALLFHILTRHCLVCHNFSSRFIFVFVRYRTVSYYDSHSYTAVLLALFHLLTRFRPWTQCGTSHTQTYILLFTLLLLLIVNGSLRKPILDNNSVSYPVCLDSYCC